MDVHAAEAIEQIGAEEASRDELGERLVSRDHDAAARAGAAHSLDPRS